MGWKIGSAALSLSPLAAFFSLPLAGRVDEL
jgi:hypothetical protein